MEIVDAVRRGEELIPAKLAFRQLAVDFPLPKAEIRVCEANEREKEFARTEFKSPAWIFIGGVHFHDGSIDRHRYRPLDHGLDRAAEGRSW